MSIQPDPTIVPRFCGFSKFARLQTPKNDLDIAIVGVPFDAGCTFRPGARFGPEAIRQSSRLLRGYSINQGESPFKNKVINDVGDIPVPPVHDGMEKVLETIYESLKEIYAKHIFIMGGDHTVSYPSLKTVSKRFGPVALIHFDSHFDTWDEYFGVKFTHGTPFKRALEEGYIDVERSIHVGIHGSVNDFTDIEKDKELGFKTIFTQEIDEIGIPKTIEKILNRVGDRPVYLSIDIDVIDPAFAPGTGTPEPGGLLSREIFHILRGIKNINLIGGDLVEVSPSYDNGNITAQLASHILYEMLCMVK